MKKQKIRKLPKFSRSISAKEYDLVLSNINKNGYVIVSNFLKKKILNSLLNKISEIAESQKLKKKTERVIYNLEEKNIIFLDILTDIFIQKICKFKLNDPFYSKLPKNKPNYTIKQISARSPIKKLDLHIDSYMPFKGNFTNMLQLVICLEEMNELNGATIICPKTHLSGTYSDRLTKNFIPLKANPGDLIIWDSRIWHGSLENLTKSSRWMIIYTLGQWWINPTFDIVKNIPTKILKKCNNLQKQLLGFCVKIPKNYRYGLSAKHGYEVLNKK